MSHMNLTHQFGAPSNKFLVKFADQFSHKMRIIKSKIMNRKVRSPNLPCPVLLESHKNDDPTEKWQTRLENEENPQMN